MSHSTTSLAESELSNWLSRIRRPSSVSHKGQNGKALIIGGSDLFHAAGQWSLAATSRWVDMLFYSSVAENNDLLKTAKARFSDGVVVPRSELVQYLEQVDAALIGPGMRRDIPSRFSESNIDQVSVQTLSAAEWEADTFAVTVALLRAYPQITWVIDAGALQVLPRSVLPSGAILTPHQGEFADLLERWEPSRKEEILDALAQLRNDINSQYQRSQPSDAVRCIQVETTHVTARLLHDLCGKWGGVTLVLKGQIDILADADQVIALTGGNAGLTKGGTGDVLAGVILGLVTTSPSFVSCVVGATILKEAGHELYQQQQEMFNASDVVKMLPQTFARLTNTGKDDK